MNKIILLLSAFALSFNVFSQTANDSISMGALYANQVFYSLDNGEVASVNNNDWELGFSMFGNGAAGSAIILNEATATLWAYPKSDTAGWAGFDTLGYSNWEQLLNTDTSWTNGAFNRYRGTGGAFDLGWGELNPLNNYWVFGDSLYLIKLNDKTFRKLWIVSLKTGTWEFKYAELDGGNEQVFSIKKADYTNRNFVYHSLVTETTIDREPDNTKWDFFFSQHVDYLSYADQHVSVTSVFNNRNVWSAKANEVDYAAAVASVAPKTEFNQRITNIGREWKKYKKATGWTIYDSIAYFVYDNDSTNFYRVVFTDFGGRGNGKAFFNKEMLQTVSVGDYEFKAQLSMYPNPATNRITLLLDYPSTDDVLIEIIDLSGKVVYAETTQLLSGVNQKTIMLNDLNSGVYIITLKNNKFTTAQKLIVR